MNPNDIPTPESRHLNGWGEVAWARLTEAAEELDLTCAWADYDGFHVDKCPSGAPPYGHIWGWSADGSTLMRGRVDGSAVTVGWLHSERQAGGRPVTCVSRPLMTWDPAHERIQPRLAQGTSIPASMVTVEVLDGMPITFVGVR